MCHLAAANSTIAWDIDVGRFVRSNANAVSRAPITRKSHAKPVVVHQSPTSDEIVSPTATWRPGSARPALIPNLKATSASVFLGSWCTVAELIGPLFGTWGLTVAVMGVSTYRPMH